MSIETTVREALADYAVSWRDSEGAECARVAESLRAALKQHVAEAVAKEREELFDLVDRYAKNNADLKAAIRARAEHEVTK